jgi:hypothetical protein
MMALRPKRFGMATVVVIGVVGVVATAVAMLTSTIAADASRTRRTVEDAQVRQLLLAESLHVSAAIAKWSDQPADLHPLPLPAELTPPIDGLKDTTLLHSKTFDTLTLRAGFGHRQGSEQLSLTHTDNHWQITRITLSP